MGAAVDLVRDFRHLRVLVIGDAMLDSYLEGDAMRLCSEGPVPVIHKTQEHRVPGGAANTAANLRALGADVAFLGVVGRDAAGTALRAAFQESGIDDLWLVEDEACRTPHKVRILADGQYVARFDEGDAGPCDLSAESHRRLLANLERAYALCDVAVVSDYGYGAASDELIDRLAALHEAHPHTLLVDSKHMYRFRRVRATVVTPNHLEARRAVEYGQRTGLLRDEGRQLRDEASPLDDAEYVGRRLLQMLDAEHAAITMAADGVFIVDRAGEALHLPAHPVPHANVAGAGDSFASALALALGAGASVVDAAQVALDAASIAVTKRWTAVVRHQELLQRVSLRDYAADPLAGYPGGELGLRRLARRLAEERQAGRTIVFTNGVFDILHAGHIQFLRQARELGDVLVVGVNSDRGARRLKGKNRPINSQRDRLALVAALDSVDHAVLFDEDDPSALIRLLCPHLHVKGGDYADAELPEAEAVREAGGRVVILPLAGSLSTSQVIERIVALAGVGLE